MSAQDTNCLMKKVFSFLSLVAAIGLVGNASASVLNESVFIDTSGTHSFTPSQYTFDTYSVEANPLIGINLKSFDSISLSFVLPQGKYFSIQDESSNMHFDLSVAYAPNSFPEGSVNPLTMNASLIFNHLDGSTSDILLGGLGIYFPEYNYPNPNNLPNLNPQAFWFIANSQEIAASSFNKSTGFTLNIAGIPASSWFVDETNTFNVVSNINGNNSNMLQFWKSTTDVSDAGSFVTIVPEPCTYAEFMLGVLLLVSANRIKNNILRTGSSS